MLSSGMKCYHLDLMLSSGTKCYHLGWNVIIWDAMLSSGANVIIWDKMQSSGATVIMVSSGANVTIWCYHVMLSSGMITHPFFIFPENFTHSYICAFLHIVGSLIYDFASDPIWISLYMRKNMFFYQCSVWLRICWSSYHRPYCKSQLDRPTIPHF